jgi:hypothetical protein
MLSDICLEDRVIVHFINTTVTTSIIHPHGNNHDMIMETKNPQKQSSEPSEDQERFEETAKFEEEIEHRPSVTKLTARKKEVATNNHNWRKLVHGKSNIGYKDLGQRKLTMQSLHFMTGA